MNPDLRDRVKARLDKIHEGTEDTFSDAFFAGVDVVSNALDNVKARIYVDSRCVSWFVIGTDYAWRDRPSLLLCSITARSCF